MTNAQGITDTVGVTGLHRVYTEDRGWVEADNLTIGEPVRGANGELTVAGLTRDLGAHRVYNMTVEADHVYYVGTVDALVHNVWCGIQAHHIDPRYLGGNSNGPTIRLAGWIHQRVHSVIDTVLQQRWGSAVQGLGRDTAKWARFFAQNKGAQQEALAIARSVLKDALNNGILSAWG